MTDKTIYKHTAAQEELADGPEYDPDMRKDRTFTAVVGILVAMLSALMTLVILWLP